MKSSSWDFFLEGRKTRYTVSRSEFKFFTERDCHKWAQSGTTANDLVGDDRRLDYPLCVPNPKVRVFGVESHPFLVPSYPSRERE